VLFDPAKQAFSALTASVGRTADAVTREATFTGLKVLVEPVDMPGLDDPFAPDRRARYNVLIVKISEKTALRLKVCAIRRVTGSDVLIYEAISD
jgi:hypothetical protein